MNSAARGNAAEAAVLQALTAAGIHALVPFGEGLPFDLGAVSVEGKVMRIQVKSGRVGNGCVEFNSSSTDHGRGQLDCRGRADVMAVHVPALSKVFMVPVDDCPSFRGYLRLDETRNGQRRRIRLAEDYSFELWVQSLETPHSPALAGRSLR